MRPDHERRQQVYGPGDTDQQQQWCPLGIVQGKIRAEIGRRHPAVAYNNASRTAYLGTFEESSAGETAFERERFRHDTSTNAGEFKKQQQTLAGGARCVDEKRSTAPCPLKQDQRIPEMHQRHCVTLICTSGGGKSRRIARSHPAAHPIHPFRARTTVLSLF